MIFFFVKFRDILSDLAKFKILDWQRYCSIIDAYFMKNSTQLNK